MDHFQTPGTSFEINDDWIAKYRAARIAELTARPQWSERWLVCAEKFTRRCLGRLVRTAPATVQASREGSRT